MKQIPLGEIFSTSYGNSLSLKEMKDGETAFIARGSYNNGVSSYVSLIDNLEPFKSNKITVALSGSVLETFYHTYSFYTGYHIKVLTPLFALEEKELLLYCSFIRANKYRYSYGRQANKTLESILLPHPCEVKAIAKNITVPDVPSNAPLTNNSIKIFTKNWVYFDIGDIFDVKKGRRLTKAKITKGDTPFIAAIDSNNGLREYIDKAAIHEKNTITVNYNGNGVAEAFYQPKDFWASDDVNVLYPKFKLNQQVAMFIITIIQKEKYRFSYGRKWHAQRMRESKIKLPVTELGKPDWEFMENYINSLPYSNNLVSRKIETITEGRAQ